MSFCSCFSPSPRLGKDNVLYDDAEPPELVFNDKQNRFSQDVLTGLRGMSAPTNAVSWPLCPVVLSSAACRLNIRLVHPTASMLAIKFLQPATSSRVCSGVLKLCQQSQA